MCVNERNLTKNADGNISYIRSTISYNGHAKIWKVPYFRIIFALEIKIQRKDI